MMSNDPLRPDAGTFAARFGSTTRDRRLESAIRRNMGLASDGPEERGHQAAGGSRGQSQMSGHERELGERGSKLAEFLVKEYSAATVGQRAFFVQLAAEIVQRIDEEIPPMGAP